MKEITVTMSFSQYGSYFRKERDLEDIIFENEMERIAAFILNNKYLTKIATIGIAVWNIAKPTLASTAEATAKIDQAGFMFLGLAQTIGYWLCIIFCIIEILKSLTSGTSRDIGGILMKYLLIFASLYLLPFGFNLIREVLG